MKHFALKIRQNQKNLHFGLYCLTFLIYGVTMNGIGPLIPYLTFNFKQPQTQYSNIFSSRLMGYVVGVIAIKLITPKIRVQSHRYLMFASLGVSLSSILFSISTQILWQNTFIFLLGISSSFYDVFLNTNILIFNKDKDKQFWLQICHGSLGVGCLLSPILVVIFQLKTYLYIGIFSLIFVAFYYNLQSPEIFQGKKQEVFQSSKQLQNQQKTTIQQQNIKKQQELSMSSKQIMILSFLILAYFGQEGTFGGWISSYSVMLGVSQKEQATIYCTLFYLALTFSRFLISSSTHNKQDQNKSFIIIGYFLIANMAVSILGLVFFYFSSHVGCYIISILYGVTTAPLYVMYVTFPYDFGHKIQKSQYSTIGLVSTLGEAVLMMIVGVILIRSLSYLFWSILFFVMVQGLSQCICEKV